jgi:lupus La protein
MSEEQKPTNNAQAEQDVQDVLAELKGDNAAPAEASKEDAEEARIVAEAAKLGEKSEQSEESQQRDNRGGRGGRGGRFANNVKFDPSQQKQTDDPVEIRKQVRQLRQEGRWKLQVHN